MVQLTNRQIFIHDFFNLIFSFSTFPLLHIVAVTTAFATRNNRTSHKLRQKCIATFFASYDCFPTFRRPRQRIHKRPPELLYVYNGNVADSLNIITKYTCMHQNSRFFVHWINVIVHLIDGFVSPTQIERATNRNTTNVARYVNWRFVKHALNCFEGSKCTDNLRNCPKITFLTAEGVKWPLKIALSSQFGECKFYGATRKPTRSS